MAKLAANLTLMFRDISDQLLQRYVAAAGANFAFVETADPYDVPAEVLKRTLKEQSLTQILINTPAGGASERGLACIPIKKQQFRESIKTALDYAKALSCPRVHVLAGLHAESSFASHANDPSFIQAEETYLDNLRYAAELFSSANVTALIEPINPVSIPNYFLSNYDQAVEYLERLNIPNLKLQLDVFHMQQICGNLSAQIKKLLPYTGHIQIAQVPHRHEPDTPGEVNYKYIFDLLQSEGYSGFIGLEYIPKSMLRHLRERIQTKNQPWDKAQQAIEILQRKLLSMTRLLPKFEPVFKVQRLPV